MEKSFKKQKNEESSEPEADAQMLADISGTETALVAANNLPTLAVGGVSGEVDAQDLVFPYLKIVYGTSTAASDFPVGALMLNADTMLVDKGEELQFVALSLRKYYEEWLEFDPNGPRPQVFNSKKELVDAGLWTDWRDDSRPPARDVADLMLLIKKPDGLEATAFSTIIGDARYALAMWKLSGSCYRSVARPIFSKMAIELRNVGLLGGLWGVHTEIKKVGNNNVPVPVLSLKDFNSPEHVAEIKSTLGGVSA